MSPYSTIPTEPVYVLILTCALWYIYSLFQHTKFNVPTVGPSAPILSYLGAIKFLTKAEEMTREGYLKYGGRPFRIANQRCWTIFVMDSKLINEVKRAGDDELSFSAAVNESLEIKYTFGIPDHHNEYHVPVVRGVLTRNIGALYDDIKDEIVQSFTELIPVKDEWAHVPVLPTMGHIIARTSSRAFVGLPLCRDPDFVDINLKYTGDVATSGMILNLVPEFLKAFTHRLVSNCPKLVDKAEALLAPIILERYSCMEQYGETWEEKPRDMLQWLMEAAEGIERTPRALAARLLVVGFGAIHTTSMTFTQTLFRLAAYPEYATPLREEIERIVAEEGLTKASLLKMRKVDSFIKECQRMEGFATVFLARKALKDFTFSDGTFVPKGCYVSSASVATHHAEHIYSDPTEFKPFRFSDMPDETGEGTKHQLANTSADYLIFGLGRHACPGRFFASSVLKTLMVHLLLTYDVKMENPRELPVPMHFGGARIPNRAAKVMFRKRRV